MLLDRLRIHIDPKLRNIQTGFRKDRSTVAQILTFLRLVERIKSRNLPDYLFDSIHRGKLMEILRAFGVMVEIVDAVNMVNTNTTNQVLSPDGDTEFFEILAGVLHGDTLAQYLFMIALDYAK